MFLVHYLVINRPEMKPGFRLSQLKLLDSEYYKQPAGVKLEILRCLCDDVIEVDSIRSELSRRMESEINVDATCMNMDLQKKRKYSTRIDPSAEEGLEGPDDGNFDECCLCSMDGSLICCDGCPAAFHSKCVGVAKDLLPEGDWYCPECLMQKGDGLKKLSKPSRGAELLGIDPHGRPYFVSCDHLLVYVQLILILTIFVNIFTIIHHCQNMLWQNTPELHQIKKLLCCCHIVHSHIHFWYTKCWICKLQSKQLLTHRI